jgi:hypothetical protein
VTQSAIVVVQEWAERINLLVNERLFCVWQRLRIASRLKKRRSLLLLVRLAGW